MKRELPLTRRTATTPTLAKMKFIKFEIFATLVSSEGAESNKADVI